MRAKSAVLEAILASAADTVVAYDRELRYVYVSPSAARILGVEPEAILGKRPSDLYATDITRPWQALAERVFESGQIVRQEVTHAAPGGEERTYEYIMTPVRDEAGQVELVVSIARDVTDERRARRELAESIDAEQRVRDRAMKLYRLAAALSRATTEQEVATAVVNEGMAALDAEAAVAYLADASGRHLLRAARGVPEQTIVDRAVLPEDAPLPLADAIRTGEPIWIESLEDLLARYPKLRGTATPAWKLQAVSAVPLRSHDRTIGGVAFSFSSPRVFDDDVRRFLLTVINHAAVGAERCRLRTEERAARKRLTILAGASRRFSEARLELRGALDTVSREVAVQLGESCAINLLTDDGRVLEPVAVAHTDPEVEEATRRTMAMVPVRMDEGSVLARVVATGEPVFIPRVPDPWTPEGRPEYREHLERYPIGSLMVVPLSARGVVLGTVTTSRGPAGPDYSRDDLALLEDLAARAGLAIADARQHEELEAERRRLDVLARTSERLATSIDYDATLHSVMSLALPTLGDFGFFDVREISGEVRRVALAHADPERQAILDQTGWVHSERRDKILCALSAGESGFHPRIDAAWLADVALSPEHLAVMESLAFGSMITVPLAYHGTVLGSLTLFFVRGGRQHTEADLRLAEELARRAAAAVENSRLFNALREAVTVRDDFLSIAGHELNTPLAALQLQIQSLKRQAEKEKLSARFLERMGKTEGHVARIERLVRELLDVSRIAGGRLTIERESMDLVAAVREVTERLAPQATHVGCTIRLSAPPSLDGSWDRLRLEQVVTNLIGNSIKYGRGEPIDVTVAADAERARISVRDFGIGISPEDETRVFGRFERAVSQRHYGGLGLGLWIARQIVEAHGGHIQFQRPPDVGTCFIVDLPR